MAIGHTFLNSDSMFGLFVQKHDGPLLGPCFALHPGTAGAAQERPPRVSGVQDRQRRSHSPAGGPSTSVTLQSGARLLLVLQPRASQGRLCSTVTWGHKHLLSWGATFNGLVLCIQLTDGFRVWRVSLIFRAQPQFPHLYMETLITCPCPRCGLSGALPATRLGKPVT